MRGGTFPSKAFDLIPRFSEDIDITVFREDIGQAVEPAELDALSGKQQRKRLDAIREACQAFINGSLTSQLAQRVDAVGKGRVKLERDPDDADGQTLLLWYPPATARTNDHERFSSARRARRMPAFCPRAPAPPHAGPRRINARARRGAAPG
ncbi:nucleotidyl transferase AbiEii/AbiGii toxin family protein [Variovorax sp. Root411]|uniref:nucleotidyl transferase AbiEii/AbiGii toxin family protein n=1 Tax=Variovorax sp. Root411 TaxID=1736530 RepID=UPI0009E74A98|nr:nucleotidyl transferase AbiEii/AbiGii toxin family protein [Variovorax sp. Root411]